MALMPLPKHEAISAQDFRQRLDRLLAEVPPQRSLIVNASRRSDSPPPLRRAPITRVPYLNLVFAGRLTVHREHAPTPVEAGPGTAVLFLPESAVATSSASGYRCLRLTWDTTLTFVAIHEQPPQEAARRPRGRLMLGTTIPGAQPPLCEALLGRCQELVDHPDPAFAMPYLMALINETRARLDQVDSHGDRRHHRWEDLDRFLRHRHGAWSRSRAAKALGLSEGHIGRLVRRHTGQSFLGYVRDLRLAQAERLLLDSQLTVQEVAERCGFSNVSHFIRLFQQRCGETPEAWRSRR